MSKCPLTQKQLGFIRLLADGKTQAEVSIITGRTRQTVTADVQKMHVACGTRTMHGLVAMALRRGWIV